MDATEVERTSTPSDDVLVPWLQKTTTGFMKGATEDAISGWLIECGFSRESALHILNTARDELLSRTLNEVSERLMAGTLRAEIVVGMVQAGWEVNTASGFVNHTANMLLTN